MIAAGKKINPRFFELVRMLGREAFATAHIFSIRNNEVRCELLFKGGKKLFNRISSGAAHNVTDE